MKTDRLKYERTPKSSSGMPEKPRYLQFINKLPLYFLTHVKQTL